LPDKSITKGALEAEISRALTQWEKNFLGRGPLSVKTDIIRNMIIVILRGTLTPAEYALANEKEGAMFIKGSRNALVESGREGLGEIIKDLTDDEVVSFFTDLSTKTGERIMVFKVSSDLEKRLMS